MNHAEEKKGSSIFRSAYDWWWSRRSAKKAKELKAHLEKRWVVVPGRPRAARRWWFAMGALGLGSMLVLRGWLLGSQPLGAIWNEIGNQFLNHLGEAFLVSAIVIIIFEWASEAMYAASLAANLASILEGHIQTVVQSSSRDAIGRAMRDLAGPHGEALETQFTEFAAAIANLGAKAGWAADGYFDFVTWYHRQLVDKIQQLADLSAALKDHPHASQEFRFPLPDASDVADVMLAQTTRAMIASGCGTYYALSDAFTWTKLPAFRQALRDAANGDILVRRLFVVGRLSDTDLPMTRLAAVIYDHYDEAKNSERYDMRIIDDDEYRLHEPLEFSRMLHFGIFKVAGDESPLMFCVLKSDLSDYRIAGGTSAGRAITEFNALFDQSPAFKELKAPLSMSKGKAKSNAVSGDILIRDYLLAYRVKRMRDRGRYCGVSNIDLWEHDELEHFHTATKDKLDTAAVTLKRIFIFTEESAADRTKIIQLLTRHGADAAEDPRRKGTYEWQVCMQETLPQALREEGACGTFVDESDDGQIVSETAINDSPHLFTPNKNKYLRLTKHFEEFWSALSEIEANQNLAKRLEANKAPSRSPVRK